MLNLFFIAIFAALNLHAQVIEAPINGIDFMQNPTYIEWKAIETDHFEIIFPKEVTAEAQRVANIMESAYPFVVRSLEDAPPKIPVVLQNHSVLSNGFVTLAPRRSEFFLTPAVDPELGNTEWLKTLGIHELRHVVQFQKGRVGFNWYLSTLLGEAGQAIGLGLTAPPWVYEGDAVGIETALTRGGRGRLPIFDRDLRTLLLSGQVYEYDKAHLGSYDDYIPSHYVYGYFYTTYLRNHYGDLFLSNLMNDSAETSWNPLSFYNSVDELTLEKNFEEFYRNVLKELIGEWKEKLSKINPTDYQVKNPEKVYGWTNYLYPQVTEDKAIFALKRGLSFINQFVLIKGKEERTLTYPGVLIQEYPYKLRAGKVAFTTLDLHPRWGYQDFSKLKVYDIEKDEYLLSLAGTKYRLAVLDHPGEHIATVSWDANQNQSLHILNLAGKILLSRPYDSDKVITSLDWLSPERLVMVIRNHQDEKWLVSYNFRSGEEKILLAPSIINMGYVAVEEGKILLETPESGIDNIYLVEDGRKQLVSSAFGSYAPDLSDGKLVYNEYTPTGMSVAVKEGEWSRKEESTGSFFPYYEKFARAENMQLLENDLQDQKIFEVEDYSQLENAINPHSWLIFAPPLSPSVTVQAFSRDILNKLSLSVGYAYNLNENTSEGFVSAAWSHLYPVFDLRAAYGGRRQEILLDSRTVENRWEEGTLSAGMQIPWRGISGRFQYNFTARAFARLIKVTNKLTSNLTELTDGTLFSPGAEAQFQYLARMALRDLNPAWGLEIFGHFEEGDEITGGDQSGSLESYDSRLYFPGLLRHHSFFHQFAYERQRDNFYQYESLIFYPRGTDTPFLDELFKYSANYMFPLFYPDWSLSRYFYLKRVNLNLFYDYLNGRVRNLDYRASSAGWEVIFDTHFLRIALPLSFGIRGSYPIEGGEEDDYGVFLASTLGTF